MGRVKLKVLLEPLMALSSILSVDVVASTPILPESSATEESPIEFDDLLNEISGLLFSRAAVGLTVDELLAMVLAFDVVVALASQYELPGSLDPAEGEFDSDGFDSESDNVSLTLVEGPAASSFELGEHIRLLEVVI